MTAKTAQIAEMIDMLPDKEIEEAEPSGYISANEIDWDLSLIHISEPTRP